MHAKHVEAVRSFNRFYTGIIGLLDNYILNSSYTLPEARVLYELYHHQQMTASDIIELLGIDKGYLSRLLLQFQKKKLVSKKRSGEDGRSVFLALTATGKKEFEKLEEASRQQVNKILDLLTRPERDELLEHLDAVRQILSKKEINKL